MGKTADPDAARRSELAAFLRARRACLQPEDVGLRAPPTRRNTPGLRREEVAHVAGVGLTWYTWLEQGRPGGTSAQMIDALARGLRLDPEAHAHLRCLASLPPPNPEKVAFGNASSELGRLLDLLQPAPACVVDERFDFVAWNETFSKIWDPSSLPPGRCNALWMALCEPARRRIWVNWEERSRTLLAEFRSAAGQHAGDPRFADLIEDLERRSTEFRRWWADYEVRRSIAGQLKIQVHGVGVIYFDVVELRVCANPTLRLAVHAPARSVDGHKLRRLMDLSSTANASRWAETG